jgi:hypothetical protein
MRLYHYSIHTERAYCDWIRKYVQALLGHSDVPMAMQPKHSIMFTANFVELNNAGLKPDADML